MSFVAPIVYLTKKLWHYSKGNRGKVVLFFSMFVIANLISFLSPLVVAHLLNVIQEQGVNADNLWYLLGLVSLLLAIPVGFWLFHGPARVLELNNSFLVRANYKKYLLDGTMSLKPEWHTDHHSGDTIDKIKKGTNALFQFSSKTFEIIEAVIRFISSYIALAYFNLHSSYLVLFLLVITFSVVIKFDNILKNYYRQLNRAENRIAAKIFDTISNITTVIILRVEKLVSRSMWRKIMEPFNLFTQKNKISETKWFLMSFMGALMTISVLGSYLIANVYSHTTIMVGTFYALYGYVNRIQGIFFRFAGKYSEIIVQRTRVENAEEISNEFKNKSKIKEIKLKDDWNELAVSGLNFSYEDLEGELHLNNLTLSIMRKEKIALIGESGSGKTTFLKLIRGLYEPQRVDLYLDDLRLPHSFQSISSDIALIPQDPEIFTTTIKENITLGVPTNKDKLKKYTDMAKFTKVIKRLPQGINSSIVEKGVNLSGGEKQRLALARGLLACEGKSLILLDEPTSSVDSKNELEIYKNIFKKFKTKTIISSIHRLHLLYLFDKVFLFKKGKLIATGSFRQLLLNSSEFQIMWRKYRTAK